MVSQCYFTRRRPFVLAPLPRNENRAPDSLIGGLVEAPWEKYAGRGAGVAHDANI